VVGTGKGGFNGDNIRATSAMLNYPSSIFVTSTDIYISDTDNHRIRKVSLVNNTITTFAGTGESGYSGDGGYAGIAKLASPHGIFVSSNALFIADMMNHVIRKVVLSNRIISTVAGSGVSGFKDNISAVNGKLSHPSGVFFSTSGELFIADTLNHRIRKVSTSNFMTTVAGTGSSGYDDNTVAISSALSNPDSVFVYGNNLLISDTNNGRVRNVSLTSGSISTVMEMQLSNPMGLFYNYGDLYVSYFGKRTVVKRTSDDVVRVIAGGGNNGFSGDGDLATKSKLSKPWGVAISQNILYISDTNNGKIRMIDQSGNITTIAGSGDASLFSETDANSAVFNRTTCIFATVQNELFFCENNSRIYRLTPSGQLSTIYDNYQYFSQSAFSDIFVSGTNIYIADTFLDVVISLPIGGGSPTVIAGKFSPGFNGDGGNSTKALLHNPQGLYVSSDTNDIYIADEGNYRIRKVSNGIISTVLDFRADQLSPVHVYYFSGNQSLVLDKARSVLIKTGQDGSQQIVAGSGSPGYLDSTIATRSSFNSPTSFSFNSSSGEIFIADTENNVIRKLRPYCSPLFKSTFYTKTTFRSGASILQVSLEETRGKDPMPY